MAHIRALKLQQGKRIFSNPVLRLLSTTSDRTAFSVHNPANGEKIAEVPEDNPGTVAEKLEKATAGARRWRATPLATRQAVLLKFAQLLSSNADRLAGTLTSETGKPIAQARNEIRATGLRVKFFVENAHQVLEPQEGMRTHKMTERIVYEPLGVVANVSAWNYPYFVAANVCGAALATGNSVLFKPSELASLSGLAMAGLLHEAGVPEDVFVATTGRAETGAAVAALPTLGGLFFTGSAATGAAITRLASPNFIKVQLELGGKDPIYVRKDVPDVAAAAAAIADGAFYNAGQSCCSVERVYVDRAIHSQFLDCFARAVEGFRVGDPMNEETYIGPLTRRAQVDVLQSQLEDALSKGAKAVVHLSKAVENLPPGNYFPPTVLADVDHSMSVMRDESFGPIIGLQAVDGDDEAARLMADTHYGLTAGVYCQHQQDAEAILAELDVGSAYWNCCDRSVPRLAWSGRKHSGVGCTLGLDGLRSFVQPKAYHLQRP